MLKKTKKPKNKKINIVSWCLNKLKSIELKSMQKKFDKTSTIKPTSIILLKIALKIFKYNIVTNKIKTYALHM